MKKILKVFLILIVILNTYKVYAEENNINTDEILEEQQKEFGISDFIEESNKYTSANLDGIDIKNIFSLAITGNIGNTNIMNSVLNILGKEFKSTLSTIRNNFYNNYYT